MTGFCSPGRKPSRQQGFTLVEVLLAMAITVIISAIAYQSLQSVLNIVESQEQQEEQIKSMGLFFSVFGKDFRQMIPRSIRNPDTTGSGYRGALLYDRDEEPMLEFTKGGWGNPSPEKFQRSHMQRIGYHLDDDKLVRYSWRMLDRYDDAEPDKAVILTGVKGFNIRFLGQGAAPPPPPGGNQGQQTPPPKWEWQTRWPPRQSQGGGTPPPPASVFETLPIGVEVEITLEKFGKLRRVYQLPEGES